MGDKGGKRPVEEIDDFPAIWEAGERSSQPSAKKPASSKAEGDLGQQEDDLAGTRMVNKTLCVQTVLEQDTKSGSSTSSSAANDPSEQRG